MLDNQDKNPEINGSEDMISENMIPEEAKHEETKDGNVPVIIYKKRQDYADYGNRYNFNAPGESVQVYRWSLADEAVRRPLRKPPKAKRNTGLIIFACALGVMFAFSALMAAVLLIYNIADVDFGGSGGNFEHLVINVPRADSYAEELTVPQIISKIKPSVVTIEAEFERGSSGFWGRGGDPQIRMGVGSGFILSEDGYIATNFHVIERAISLFVRLDDGRRYPAELIGGDEEADLAIIKINARNLTVAELGNSDYTIEGEFVVAIGSPGGIEFAGSSTFGIISGVNREIEVSRGRSMTLLQTDASINPGNSGGPLVNMRGQVIGINTLKLAANFLTNNIYEGMGFAIPITFAAGRFNDILANPGEINWHREYSIADLSTVSFGISGRTVSEAASYNYNVPRGVEVFHVTPDGTCGRAGVLDGDIIIALDGERIESFERLVMLKHDYSPGDEAVLTVYRDGEELNFNIIFDARN